MRALNTRWQSRSAFAALTTVVVLIAMTVSVYAWMKFNPDRLLRFEGAPQEPRARTVVRDKKEKPAHPVEVVPITIRSTGFEPAELQLPEKTYVLAIDNQSGLDDVSVEIVKESKGEHSKIKDLALSLKALRRREVMDLKAGRYLLREINHPEWSCLITVKAT